MAINLLNNSMIGIGQGGQVQSGRAAGEPSALMRQAAVDILKEVNTLSVGDTLQGQLVSKDGNSIELLLGDNARLTTMLEQDMNLSLGQIMSFEVKSNQGGQLTLRPLFANMSNSTTIMSALDAAGIAASDTSVKMVDTLMQNGMPVNKDMLHTINRELSRYPDAVINDIVMLHKMDIPVNEGNVRQMHLYNNNNQWMLENVNDSATELTNLLANAIKSADDSVQNILDGLKELLPPAESDMTNEVMAEEGVSSGAQTVAAEGEEASLHGMPSEEAASGQPSAANMTDTVRQQGALDEHPGQQAVMADKAEASGVHSANTQISNAADNTSNVKQSPDTSASKEDILTQTDKQSVEGRSLQEKAAAPAINKNNVFDKLQNMDPRQLSRPEIKAQIKSAITELLKDNFLMNPKDIKEEKFIQKYYERTMNLADGLEKLMAENGKTDTDFAKTIANVRENTTFMNHVNDLYNYVQLPLKMNDSQANGDLYVYARKKGRGSASPDGKLTALLHLNMDHLGAMDIFLTLSEGQKLNTRFIMEKEEMIDFIASHIDELNARLEKKGYNVGTVVCKKDEPDKTAIENIIGKSENIMLSTQSFDARA